MGVFFFWFLSVLTVVSAVGVVALSNPVYSAFALVTSMLGLSGLFILLGAHYVAMVQIIVYAGAVLVLFVMVMMLFDLKKETARFAPRIARNFLSFCAALGLTGFLVSRTLVSTEGYDRVTVPVESEVELATRLFTRYVFVFELIGVFLLVIAIGVVAMSRARGGTHVRD